MSESAKPPATLRSLEVYQDQPHPCPYLPDRLARTEFMVAARLDAGTYEQLMNLGFRRSGHLIYRPHCGACAECVPLRVPVASFTLSRSQRRVLRRNNDLSVTIGPPRSSDRKHALYRAYLAHQHDGSMGESRADLEDFLYRSPTQTFEMVYRAGPRIVAVGIVDRCQACLSSVYFYYDPDEAWRSLGVYGALVEIERCREWKLPYWYAGFFVRDSRRMNYKAQFRPYELLGPDGVWRPEAVAAS